MTLPDARATADAGDPIKHVVLLLLENRSFDQMLGAFKRFIRILKALIPTLLQG